MLLLFDAPKWWKLVVVLVGLVPLGMHWKDVIRGGGARGTRAKTKPSPNSHQRVAAGSYQTKGSHFHTQVPFLGGEKGTRHKGGRCLAASETVSEQPSSQVPLSIPGGAPAAVFFSLSLL